MLKILTFLALLNLCNCAPANTSTNGDVAPCLKEFYQVAYDGIYHCTKEFDFFSTCISSNCYYSKAEISMVSAFCETVKMSNTEFKACEWKIKRESPDLSEYECLEGEDFYDPAILNKYRFYTKMKDCTTEIMIDICGEKAVIGFEKYAELSADFLIKAAKMQRAMSEVMVDEEDGLENEGNDMEDGRK
ncbi:hypothetical protein B9Z55_017272 [Caenorhabditis nigoni]|uniref:T20D4.11-like domain-containing protein n=1 Tax=Caenorhabditis nigoni TaxID=1611254 RepID=A0A2G5T8X9_9PELO|nr:hypothetical protein B9Z55_017272 [Caenorhabditis nigoni]